MWDKESGEITERQPSLENPGSDTSEVEGDEEGIDGAMERCGFERSKVFIALYVKSIISLIYWFL